MALNTLDFEIAIPSHKRADKLLRCTLAFLEREQIDKSKITIFVADSELETYKAKIPADYQIVQGKLGLSNQRKFIMDYYPLGANVVCLDDDIRNIKNLSALPFEFFCELMFSHCHTEDAYAWGIYPCNNLFFCKDRVLKGSLYLVGCCYGYINKKDIPLWLPPNGIKEDCFFSLYRIHNDGHVLRYDGACPDTDYYALGGLSEVRDFNSEATAARAISAMFDGLAEYKVKKNGHPEVKIKRRIEKEFPLMPVLDSVS